MKERIQLLDIKVDIVSTKDAADLTRQYLVEESSRVVYFANSETLLLLQENERWKDLVEESELILPGNSSINANVDEVLGHKRDPFFFESYFDAILDSVIEMGKEMFLVTVDEEKFVSVQEHIHEKRPFLSLSGMFLTQQEETLGYIVNEINSAAPDILILALDEKRQLELLEQFRTQINAGLFLFTGNILYNHAVVEADVPEQIEKLNMEGIYRWFRMSGRIKNFFNNLKVRIKLKFDSRQESDD